MTADPLQLAPPFDGAGLVHVRLWFMRPPPQYELFAMHTDHELHADQLPFTAARTGFADQSVRQTDRLDSVQ